MAAGSRAVGTDSWAVAAIEQQGWRSYLEPYTVIMLTAMENQLEAMSFNQ